MANTVGMLIRLFFVLAGFAGTIGGILLIIEGEWSLLFYLFFVSIIAPFAMAFVMFPVTIFVFPAVLLKNNGYQFLSKIFGWLGSLYLGIVFAAWSAYIFTYVMNSTETFWGGVFSSFGTAISPIVYMSSKDPVENELDSVNRTFVMLTAKISLLSMVVMGILNGGSLYEIGIFYFTAYAVLSAVSIIIVSRMFKFLEN